MTKLVALILVLVNPELKVMLDPEILLDPELVLPTELLRSKVVPPELASSSGWEFEPAVRAASGGLEFTVPEIASVPALIKGVFPNMALEELPERVNVPPALEIVEAPLKVPP